jgi:hypothetical protein
MKRVQIGNKQYNLCESVNDINDKRFNYFKMYMLKSLEGIDRPLFKATLQQATDFLNQSKYFQAFGKFQDYLKAIEFDGYNEDALSKCFALICLRDGEDQLNVDENFLNEKLAEMWNEGLTRGFVEGSVQNFTISSPLSFGQYSAMLEEVTEKLDQTFWDGLRTLQGNPLPDLND